MNRVGTLDGRKKYPTGRWGEYRSGGRSSAWDTLNNSRLEAEGFAATEACREHNPIEGSRDFNHPREIN